jgi:hypothetical protein
MDLGVVSEPGRFDVKRNDSEPLCREVYEGAYS